MLNMPMQKMREEVAVFECDQNCGHHCRYMLMQGPCSPWPGTVPVRTGLHWVLYRYVHGTQPCTVPTFVSVFTVLGDVPRFLGTLWEHVPRFLGTCVQISGHMCPHLHVPAFGDQWIQWISIDSMDIHGFHGYHGFHGNSWNPWICMDSVDIHGFHGYS